MTFHNQKVRETGKEEGQGQHHVVLLSLDLGE